MYVCGTCKNEAEYPGACPLCNEKMDCTTCAGAEGADKCLACQELEGFQE
ncbi:MAG TPA: hypothetical protein P5056_00915 [Candidatus Paceibacterota bacterium]|nr:hypothetical protein [Candidatus Paceibacterota bacterium]